MDRPFDSDLMDEADAADAMDEELGAQTSFDEGDAGDGFEDALAAGDAGDADLAQDDTFSTDSGDDFSEGADDMALWNAFEEEIADGLDAADDDEFFGRLLGGLGRAAGVVGRGLGGAAGAAGRVGRLAQGAGRLAGRVGQVAGAVSPAALAAARLARMLGAPGVAGALGQVGRAAQTVGRGAGQAQGLAGSLGQMAGGAQGLFGQLSQLLGQGGNEFDAFDDVIDLYTEDGVDEALPAAVALAARAAARGLGFRNVAQLSQGGRRALVRGIASAARELARSRMPQAIRALPRLAHSAARVAQRRVPTPQRAVQTLRRGLPQTARQIAQSPRAVQRLTTNANAPRPLARPTNIGRGLPGPRPRGGPRQFTFSGPVTLTITPR
jgi:hypothetical protein